jgi:hypothetical protein
MAEFLIRVHDKVNPDSVYSDVKCLKRGDVVSVCPDGWVWSTRELRLPFWRIVKVAGMAMDEAEAFLSPEPGDSLLNKMLRRRAFKVDVDRITLPKRIKEWLADDTRAVPFLEINTTTARGLKTLKEPLSDPAVIG